jgi:2'-5' RNA ligase
MKRIFTAIDISDEARAKCTNYVENLRSIFPHLRVGWEKPEKLHFTMKFLGDIDEAQLRNLTESVAASAEKSSNFKLRIANTGAFPSKRNARILWLGVNDEHAKMPKLKEVLEGECFERGLTRENRDFKAHLTIARLREPHKSAELVEKHLSEYFVSDEFTVSAVTIYESRLQKSGSIYSIVSKHEFKVNSNYSEHS